MELLITHKSALEYWRLNGVEKCNLGRNQARRTAPDNPPSSFALYHASKTFGLSLPIVYTVGMDKARRTSEIAQPHSYCGYYPKGSLIEIDEGFLISSPELCFYQMSSELSFCKLIELGFELCGTYVLPVQNTNVGDTDSKRFYGRKLLTTASKMEALSRQMRKSKYQKLVHRSLVYIADNSASPMETKLTMLLTLPYSMGGYAFPMPELNAGIIPSKSARKSSSQTSYSCDLFWPEYNLAIEYDSKMYHSEIEKIDKDSRKRNSLTALGITVITVTSQQMRNAGAFEKVAHQLASNMDWRLRHHERPSYAKARLELRNMLL
ncbi:MAG: hypothetical protein LBU61_01655 [Coriobacteriales bacterium]|jgi:hypothetical protein|nr:hypothetical protein [Coriobacteriales bacterium]